MRFSAMGDVVMTLPVVCSLAKQHPDLRITVLTRGRFTPFFHWAPPNVEVRGVDLGAYKGVNGLLKLFNELDKYGFTDVADLHDVLRTKVLRFCFKMSGTRVAVIDKGRADKKRLVACGAAKSDALKPMTERYADVFRRLGLDVKLDFKRVFNPLKEDFFHVNKLIGVRAKTEKWVGVAPFAAHPGKIYPLDMMRRVVDVLDNKGYRVFLFGAGEKEASVLENWQSEGIMSLCGKLGGLHNEMLLISRLDLMIAMDSANMHMAAVLGVPTLSIWGATHPKAGFMGWNQSGENVLQLDLPCRPCSVYGNKPCRFGDLRCLAGIGPEAVIERVEAILNGQRPD